MRADSLSFAFRRHPRTLCAGLLAALFAGLVQAGPAVPEADMRRRYYLELGRGEDQVRSTVLGINLPWSLDRMLLGGRLSGHWDAYVAQWRADSPTAGGGRAAWTQLSLTPALRLRYGDGRSSWFMEGGIGVSMLDRQYRSAHKSFSTRFNFSDHQAFGYSFGTHGEHELMLLVRHVSNAGIKKPNPGEDFLQLRYSLAY